MPEKDVDVRNVLCSSKCKNQYNVYKSRGKNKNEYAHSNYTHILKGANAKAKANAVQGLPQLIEIATGKQFKENHKEKHVTDAGLGWYRYEARFALPIFDESGEVERYNVFHAALLMRHALGGKLYLYDIMAIKKETSNLFQSEDLTQ